MVIIDIAQVPAENVLFLLCTLVVSKDLLHFVLFQFGLEFQLQDHLLLFLFLRLELLLQLHVELVVDPALILLPFALTMHFKLFIQSILESSVYMGPHPFF